jgi:hypothetical protein
MIRKTNDSVILEMLDAGRTQADIARHFCVSAMAICKRVRKLRPPELPEALKRLTVKERKFALAKAEGKTATQAALASFECGSMDSAKSIGSELSKRDDIQKAVAVLLQEEGLGRRRRAQILSYHAENLIDSQASLKAVDLANRMENLYIEKQLNVNVDYGEICRDIADVRARRRELARELGLTEEDILEEVSAPET